MYNKKLKKLLATLLATAMVFGCCATAFATDPDPDPSGTDPSQQQSDPQNNNDSGSGTDNSGSTTPATPGGSGGATGVGESEGHVDKFKVTMVLPTVDANTFKYIVDPEKLIEETSGAKYTGMTFPAAATDTHVYFKTGATTYANTTNTFYAVNKGTKPVTLTVTVKAVSSTDPTKDLGLATAADTLTSDENSLLYLGLTVGDETKTLSTTEQTVTKTVAGTANYKTTYTAENGYQYTEKDAAEGTLGNSWNAIAISLTGKVGDKPIATDATSPSVSVTWSWAEAAADATVTEGAATTVTEYTDDTGATSYLTAAEATAKLAELSSSSSGSGTDNSGSGTDNSGSGTDTSGSGTTPAPDPTPVLPDISPNVLTATGLDITIQNGGTVSTIKNNSNGVTLTNGQQYSISGTTITFKPGMVSNNANGTTLTITFSDGTTRTLTVQK